MLYPVGKARSKISFHISPALWHSDQMKAHFQRLFRSADSERYAVFPCPACSERNEMNFSDPLAYLDLWHSTKEVRGTLEVGLMRDTAAHPGMWSAVLTDEEIGEVLHDIEHRLLDPYGDEEIQLRIVLSTPHGEYTREIIDGVYEHYLTAPELDDSLLLAWGQTDQHYHLSRLHRTQSSESYIIWPCTSLTPRDRIGEGAEPTIEEYMEDANQIRLGEIHLHFLEESVMGTVMLERDLSDGELTDLLKELERTVATDEICSKVISVQVWKGAPQGTYEIGGP